MMKMKNRKKFVSLFEKSVIVFMITGIVPLFILGYSLYKNFSKQFQVSLIANYSQMNTYLSQNISDIVDELDEISKSVYGYQIADYDYFYQLIKDKDISETQRELWITSVLRNILYSNQYINQVYWIEETDKVYASMRPPEKMVNKAAMNKWYEENKNEATKEITVLPTHVSSYFFYSTRQDVTFVRNIMDTSTIKGAQRNVLGTLYIDMSIDRISNLVNDVSEDTNVQFYIIDTTNDVYIYNAEYYKMGESAEEVSTYFNENYMDEETYIQTNEGHLLITPITNTDWILAILIPDTEISMTAKAMQQSTMWILMIAAISVGIIYWLYSKITSTPLRKLKDAMVCIQNGNLDTHIEIDTNDEIGIMAEGLNQMTQNLKTHINKVYTAEIKQRDAELSALKSQIRPHYLYNTLEVIRMMAITNDDYITADMLDSLSRQLKYLMGTTKELVFLKDEIENIKDYFKLLSLRFDNLYLLDLDVKESLMKLKVPHLILQPIVENAIKHGLRPSGEEGQVGIIAHKTDGYLEISVIDNGIGMPKEKLNEIRNQFNLDDIGDREQESLGSIGMKNVYERIILKFGNEFGLEILSHEKIGTIVKYKLPIIEGGE